MLTIHDTNLSVPERVHCKANIHQLQEGKLFGTTTRVQQATTISLANILTQTGKIQWMEAEFPSILKPTLSKLSTIHTDSLIQPVTKTFPIYSMIAMDL